MCEIPAILVWKISAHVSCDPLELLHVAHCAQYSSWWTIIARLFSLKTTQNSSIRCQNMNKTQGTAEHVKNETFIRLLQRAFQTKIILTQPQRAQLSLSRARALALYLCSFHTHSDHHKYPPRANTWGKPEFRTRNSDRSSLTCQTWETCLKSFFYSG